MTARIFLLYALSIVLVVPSSNAQVSSGTILGTITDPSGANIVGVSVTVTDAATNFQRKVVTGNDGAYVAPNLKPGEYRITAAVPGFRTQTLEGIVLQVDQHARIDIMLQIGDVSQEVTVLGAAPVIASENATIGEVVDNQKVLELPLNGRQYLQLAFLTPGVQRTSVNAAFYDESGGSFAANGTDPGSNTTMVDGVINMEFGAGRQNYSPSLDMIQEFKIQSNTYDAAFGLSGAAQVNVVTKRGSTNFTAPLSFSRAMTTWMPAHFSSRGRFPSSGDISLAPPSAERSPNRLRIFSFLRMKESAWRAV